jgi:DNA-binding transcriptional LysR family regulator
MPTLKQLKALSLIAQTGSFTKSAERLFITQSAVSALIRELEQEVGLPLIQRGRTIRLTEAGEHLQRAGGRADHEIERALQEVRGGKAWTQTLLRIAAGPLSAATLMPAVISRLRREQSGFRTVIIDRPVGTLGDVLLSGEADVAIGSIDSPLRLSSDLRSTLLLNDQLAAVCSPGSMLAGLAAQHGEALAWPQLAEAELILVARMDGQWNSLLQDELSRHEALTVAHEVQLFSTALELVRHNLGVAILPRRATLTLDRAAFCVCPLSGSSATWNTYTVVRKGAEAKEPAIGVFLQALRTSVASGA